MTPAAQAIAGTPILRPPSIRCRSLTLSGRMCRATALRGQDLCVRHAEHRYPVLQRGPDVTLPLLEDLESVQIFATQVMQGVLADSIDIHRAGKLLYGCQIVANTMPRPARLKPSKEQESPAEPVTEVFSGPDFHLLGPIEDTRKQARFDSYWSFDKFRYEQECERLGRPAPKTPADMPESGWLNPEDLDRIAISASPKTSLLNDGYCEKMLELRLEADVRGKLPPLAERKCSYGDGSWCRGPGAQGRWQQACACCIRELDAYCRLHPDQPKPACSSDDPTDLQAVAEEPSTPDVKSVNIPKPRRSNALPNHPTQGGTPFPQFGGAATPRFRGTTSVILSPPQGRAILQPESPPPPPAGLPAPAERGDYSPD